MKRIRQFLSGLLTRLFGHAPVHYINGPEVLPPPLTPAEERALLERCREDESARNELIVHNLRLVVYIAKRFDAGQSNVEDLISIGTIGLMKAVATFSPDKNIKLATYASRCIENEILMFLRKTGNQRGELSLDAPLNVDWEGNELLLGDILGSDGDEIDRNLEQDQERDRLHEAIRELPQRDREIMCMRFGLYDGSEMTQKEVADALGISQSYISRLEKRILGQLRQRLEAM